jgi:hypothetical protein
MARGAVNPGRDQKFKYALYVSNGPRLDVGAGDPRDAGRLRYDDHDDNNSDKAFGGRIGFQPIPEFEMGLSFQRARVGEEDTAFENVDAVLYVADVNYVAPIDWLEGTLDARVEWAWSDVDRANYGAGAFTNRRDGGYAQVAYRPSKVESDFFKNVEAVVRYDALNLPSGAPAIDEYRLTFGLDYWIRPGLVIKGAYQIIRRDGSDWDDAFLFEVALGF